MACRLYTTPSHYLTQCLSIAECTLRNKQKLESKYKVFIQGNTFEIIVWKMRAILSRLQCVKSRFLSRHVNKRRPSSSHIKPLSHQDGVLAATARRPRKLQNAEVRAVGSHRAPTDRRGIAVASPLDVMGSPRTPYNGAHFGYAQSVRRGSEFPRRT